MKTYIDNLKTRRRVVYETRRYYYVSYDDWFWGQWVGNVNVFDKTKRDPFVLHATLEKAMTYDELKKYAEEYEKSILGQQSYEAKELFDALFNDDEKGEQKC